MATGVSLSGFSKWSCWGLLGLLGSTLWLGTKPPHINLLKAGLCTFKRCLQMMPCPGSNNSFLLHQQKHKYTMTKPDFYFNIIFHFCQAQLHFPSYMSLYSIHLTFLYFVLNYFFLSNNAALFQSAVGLFLPFLHFLHLNPWSLNQQSTAAWRSAVPFLPSISCLGNMGDCKQPIQFVEDRSVLSMFNQCVTRWAGRPLREHSGDSIQIPPEVCGLKHFAHRYLNETLLLGHFQGFSTSAWSETGGSATPASDGT